MSILKPQKMNLYEQKNIEILNIKETTIQTRLMRARAKIKSMVKGDWLDE